MLTVESDLEVHMLYLASHNVLLKDLDLLNDNFDSPYGTEGTVVTVCVVSQNCQFHRPIIYPNAWHPTCVTTPHPWHPNPKPQTTRYACQG